VDVKGMAKVVGIAVVVMVVWSIYKVYFVHDPDNFTFMDARPHLISWMSANCKQYQCNRSGGGDGTAIKEEFEVEDGWVYVLSTYIAPDYEVAVLVPRDNPRNKHVVELERPKKAP
jgi:hypothetical protein